MFEEQRSQTNSDLMVLPVSGDEVSGWKPGTPAVFLNTPFIERDAAFSPDGKWLGIQQTTPDATKCTCGRSRGPAANGRPRLDDLTFIFNFFDELRGIATAKR